MQIDWQTGKEKCLKNWKWWVFVVPFFIPVILLGICLLLISTFTAILELIFQIINLCATTVVEFFTFQLNRLSRYVYRD